MAGLVRETTLGLFHDRNRRHVAIAVACAIFDLLADLPERAAFPCHRERREVPFRMAWHMRRIEVGRSVAGAAWKSRGAVAVGAAHDQRLMRPPLIGLARTVARGMAIHTARMLQHLAGLLKQRKRTRLPIGNA